MTEKKKILICDDEEGIRESLNLILKDSYNLIFATNGQECLETLKKDKNINLVLMDIKMPKQNGIDVTRDIKRLNPNIKVIVVTGYESAEIAQEATSAGADAYITKPFESKDILKKIGAYL
jgi:CheY-like chemotaxis protein